jgi:hypothetical protein
MTLKTLLLGSAAAFAVVGGAQAADLSVAEPVESVKICQTFGNGYWYIPGTDTCLKIGGKVEFDINLHALSSTYDAASQSGHSSNYDFVTKIGLNFDASSMTDVGALVGHVNLKGTYSGTASEDSGVYLDNAWLAIGALKAGHFGSLANPGGAFADDVYKSSINDNNHMELSWAAAGFGLALGIEDPRSTWQSELPLNWSMPLITGKVTMSQAMWSGAISGGFVQLASGSSWGVDGQITFNLDSIAAGDKLVLNAEYGDNAFIGGGNGMTSAAGTNNGWSAFVSFQHMWSSTLKTGLTYSYLQRSGGQAAAWRAGADLVWTPYAGFAAKLGGQYIVDPGTGPGSWTGLISLTRSW